MSNLQSGDDFDETPRREGSDTMSHRRAIICGHSSGLGLALATQLLADGYEVLGVSRRSAPLSGIEELSLDFSRYESVEQLSDYVRANFDAFDLFVYCAGVLVGGGADEISHELLDLSLRVNAIFPMALESRMFDLFRKNAATIVNVTSSSIAEYYPKLVTYSASKSALQKFTSDLQKALASTSARVIEICPSGFQSEMYSVMLGEQIERDESIQMAAEDVASLVLDCVHTSSHIEVGRVVLNRKVV